MRKHASYALAGILFVFAAQVAQAQRQAPSEIQVPPDSVDEIERERQPLPESRIPEELDPLGEEQVQRIMDSVTSAGDDIEPKATKCDISSAFGGGEGVVVHGVCMLPHDGRWYFVGYCETDTYIKCY